MLPREENLSDPSTKDSTRKAFSEEYVSEQEREISIGNRAWDYLLERSGTFTGKMFRQKRMDYTLKIQLYIE